MDRLQKPERIIFTLPNTFTFNVIKCEISDFSLQFLQYLVFELIQLGRVNKMN